MPLGVGWRIHEGNARNRPRRVAPGGNVLRSGPLIGADDQFAVHAPTLTASADLIAPQLASAATVNATLPSILGFASGREQINGVNAELGSVAGEAYGGGYAAGTLGAVTIEAAGTVVNLGTVNKSLPAITCEADGRVSGLASVNRRLPSITGIAYSGAVLEATLGGVTLEATGKVGAVGSVVATLPAFEIEASGDRINSGQVDAELPAMVAGPYGAVIATLPAFQIVAEGHAVVAATYEAYAVNLTHRAESVDEVTRYTNFPFDCIVRWKGSYFGVHSSGLYLLAGTTDHASPTPTAIPWAWKTGETDFDNPNQKNVPEVFFGGRMGAAATVNLYVGEGAAVPHSFTTPRGALAQNHRQKFGKGNKARYYAVGASGQGVLELDELDPQVVNLTRRI